MTPTLYQYVHCPFCVRVRMALGYLGVEYQSVVVPYDDEKTPISLIGKKMLPIMVIDGKAMSESLDIIEALDTKNLLHVSEIKSDTHFKEFESRVSQLGSLVHSLAMPFWMHSPEFNAESRVYFQKKKELKRGPFSQLVQNQKKFIDEISPLLDSVEKQLCPFYDSQSFSLKDLMIAAQVWGLYSVPEFQFSPRLHQYLQSVKQKCNFIYQKPFWELI